MLKVIHFIPGLTMGGAETLVKDYALGLDRSKFTVIILCSIKWGSSYETILADAGIRVVYINDYIKNRPRNLIKRLIIQYNRYRFVKKFFLLENPDILHVHLGLLRYVKFANPKCKIFYTVHNISNWVWGKNKKEEKAARWLLRNSNFHFITLHKEMKISIDNYFGINDSLILNNGIDFEHFKIQSNSAELKKKLHIPENSFIIGHVGRFVNQKNHLSLVDIFCEVIKRNQDAFLLMIGDGELKRKVSEKLESYGLQNNYLILSNRTDIPELMRMMNVFVFPSFFEGLGIVLIEAQVSKLKCIVSENVPVAAKVSNLIKFKSLSETAKSWAEDIVTFSVPVIEYYGIEDWDMKNVIKTLESFYEKI